MFLPRVFKPILVTLSPTEPAELTEFFLTATAETAESLVDGLIKTQSEVFFKRIAAKKIWNTIRVIKLLEPASIGAQYSKQNMIKFSQCLAELAQEFKFL